MADQNQPGPGIFISYRRDDTRQAAGRLGDELVRHFGKQRVFRDVEGIQLGVDFTEALSQALTDCHVVLVLIGGQWLKVTDEQGVPRLHRPDDWVRTEIATALKRNIRLVPVLIDDASLPSAEELPDELRPLVKRQLIRLADVRWHRDVSELIDRLSELDATAPAPSAPAAPAVTPSAAPDQATPPAPSAMAQTRTGRAEQGNGQLIRAGAPFMDAAARGDPVAQFNLALALEQAGEIECDREALKWYRNAAEKGHADALYHLGVLQEEGRGGLHPDQKKALSAYVKAAEGGSIPAQRRLGGLYREGRWAYPDKAVSYLLNAAKAGDATAQFNLGQMYQKGGGGLRRDEAEALSWFRQSAEQGHDRAQCELCRMFRDGLCGVPQDDQQALDWCLKAAAQGNPLGQYYAGLMREEGRGGPAMDEVEAVRWYTLAAQQGLARAQCRLAFMYSRGRGGLMQDDAAAAAWYAKAAESGDQTAQYELGLRYEHGSAGLPKDTMTARTWYERAANTGHGDAKAKLKRWR